MLTLPLMDHKSASWADTIPKGRASPHSPYRPPSRKDSGPQDSLESALHVRHPTSTTRCRSRSVLRTGTQCPAGPRPTAVSTATPLSPARRSVRQRLCAPKPVSTAPLQPWPILPGATGQRTCVPVTCRPPHIYSPPHRRHGGSLGEGAGKGMCARACACVHRPRGLPPVMLEPV